MQYVVNGWQGTPPRIAFHTLSPVLFSHDIEQALIDDTSVSVAGDELSGAFVPSCGTRICRAAEREF